MHGAIYIDLRLCVEKIIYDICTVMVQVHVISILFVFFLNEKANIIKYIH